jgi:hypothetical protein
MTGATELSARAGGSDLGMNPHYGIRGAQRKRLAINKKGPDEPLEGSSGPALFSALS